MSDFDVEEQCEYFMYLDAKNLYGWVISQPLPYVKFEWVNDFTNFDINIIVENSEFGYILEVDLLYPEAIHDRHIDLAFCAENKCIAESKIGKLIADL